jgi:predicted transcriptional regulator
MTLFQSDPDLEETGAGFIEKAVVEAIRATLAPQSLLGDLPAELTLGMRLRRELALRNVMVSWSRGSEKRGAIEPYRARQILWHEDNRDRPIGRALVSTLAHVEVVGAEVPDEVARDLVGALRRRGLSAAPAWNRIACFRGFTDAQMPGEMRREYRDSVIEAFGDALSAVSKNSDISVVQTARLSGLSRGYVLDVMECRKDSVPSLDVLFRLRSSLRCSAVDMVARIENHLKRRGGRMKRVSLRNQFPTEIALDPTAAEELTLSPPRDALSLAFATILRATRLRLGGLSQEHFALEAGLDRTHVSQLERARTHPSVATVIAVAHRLGVQAGTYVGLIESLIRTKIDDAHAYQLLDARFGKEGAL